MGITIHYELRFRGGEERVKQVLRQIGEIAANIGFRESQKLWQVDYQTDFNHPDEFTPMADGEGKRQGKKVIDETYRWAKIQYEPPIMPMLSYQDSPVERRKKELQIARGREQIWKYSGWVQHLWFGEGCEPTNIGLVRYGKSSLWTGSAFTKTQWAEDFVKAHVAVCTLLKEVEKLGILESVNDESGFWNEWDITKLIDSGDSVLEIMRKLTPTLEQLSQATGCKLQGPGLKAKSILQDHSLDIEDKRA